MIETPSNLEVAQGFLCNNFFRFNILLLFNHERVIRSFYVAQWIVVLGQIVNGTILILISFSFLFTFQYFGII